MLIEGLMDPMGPSRFCERVDVFISCLIITNAPYKSACQMCLGCETHVDIIDIILHACLCLAQGVIEGNQGWPP